MELEESVEEVKETPGTSPVVEGRFNQPIMNFWECVTELLNGSKCRRLEWPTDGTYITIHEEKLMIRVSKDGKLHPLVVSTGDLLGEDWVVVAKP